MLQEYSHACQHTPMQRNLTRFQEKRVHNKEGSSMDKLLVGKEITLHMVRQ